VSLARRRLGPAIGLVTLAALLAGCGNSRTPVPGPGAPAPAGALRTLYLVPQGIIVHIPRSWSVAMSKGPLLATISSGSAVVALWRYPRAGAVPSTPAALRGAQAGLLAAAKARDPKLEAIRTAAITLSGRPGIELDAFEHINGQLRRVRSVHVFGSGSEVVLDEYAPPSEFHPVDHSVFSPVKRSLRLLR
jgi:hypothetical protein